MSSTTSRVVLYKPAGGENVNVTTDLNNNLDKIDTNLNFRVVANAAARNAISPFWAGLNVRETDTGRTYVSNGTAPISGSWSQIPNTGSTLAGDLDLASGTQVNINANNGTGMFAGKGASVGTDFLNAQITGDTTNRYVVNADGATFWGGGVTTQDVKLYRDSANVLKTDDAFVVALDHTVLGNLKIGATGATIRTGLGTQTTVANTNTETVVATLTVPANDAVVGAVYKLTAWGVGSTTGTPTILFRGRFSGISGTQFAQSGSISTASGVSNKAWRAEMYLSNITLGSTGTWFGNLHVIEGLSVAGTNPVTTPGQRIDGGTTLTRDTTISNTLVLTIAWGTPSASNTLTCFGFCAERVA